MGKTLPSMSRLNTFAALSLLGSAGLTVAFQARSAHSAPEWVPIAPKAPIRLAAASDVEGAKFFDAQVQPLLSTNCVRCHGGDKAKGGLKLDSREAILKGGDSGAAVKLDKPADSLLLKAVGYADADLKMPPAGKMSKAQIDVLTKWIAIGSRGVGPTSSS